MIDRKEKEEQDKTPGEEEGKHEEIVPEVTNGTIKEEKEEENEDENKKGTNGKEDKEKMCRGVKLIVAAILGKKSFASSNDR